MTRRPGKAPNKRFNLFDSKVPVLMTAPITRSAELVRRRGLEPDCIRCIATNVTLCRMNKKRKERWLYTQIVKVKEELDSNGERAEKDSGGTISIVNVPKLKQDVTKNI